MPDCVFVRAVNKAMMQTCLDSGCRYLIERWDDVLGVRPGAKRTKCPEAMPRRSFRYEVRRKGGRPAYMINFPQL